MTDRHRSLRRTWRAAVLAALVSAGVLLPTPQVATARTMGVDTERVTERPSTAAGRVRAIRDKIAGFRLFGATWDGPAERGRVRFHTASGWSEWHPLEDESEDGPDLGSREGQGARAWTAPIWVGEADGYEIDLPADVGSAAVHLVRERAAKARVDTSGARAQAATAAPPINGRGSWGARAPKVAPTYANVKVAFVHHTVDSNTYAQSDVPAMLRGIQAYHMDANGWDDIGYNFLVDRFGGIWEGRQGGIDRGVVGAHAEGFNTGSTGVAVLGDFTSTAPSGAAVNAVGQLLGWKLPLHGVDPQESVQFTSGGSNKYPKGTVVTVPNISSHRDVGQTSCPGQLLYEKLPTIRSAAAGWAGTVTAYPGFLKGVFVGAGQLASGGNSEIVTGADAGGGPHVQTFNSNGTPRSSFFAYPSAFSGGVRVAIGNIDAIGDDEIITAAGPGGGPHVRALHENGSDVVSMYAYDPGFRGGTYVASGNVDGLAGDEIITAPGAGGGPHVKVFNALGQVVGQFMAYDPAFSGGVRVAATDVDGDGVDEIITAPGPGGGPHVKIFRLNGSLVGQFMAYAPSFGAGLYVGGIPASGNQPGRVVTGPDSKGGPHIRVFNASGGVVGEFLTPPTTNTSGVRVAGGEFSGGGAGDVALTFGPGGQPVVRLTTVSGELLLP